MHAEFALIIARMSYFRLARNDIAMKVIIDHCYAFSNVEHVTQEGNWFILSDCNGNNIMEYWIANYDISVYPDRIELNRKYSIV